MAIGLAALIIILFNIVYITSLKTKLKRYIPNALFFSVLLCLELLLVATGGLYSPFLVLVYLASFAIGFFFDFKSFLLFLNSILLVLLLNMILNAKLLSSIQEDPWKFYLYLGLFVVILPITYVLIKQISSKKQTPANPEPQNNQPPQNPEAKPGN
jgi:hypothetical protein